MSTPVPTVLTEEEAARQQEAIAAAGRLTEQDLRRYVYNVVDEHPRIAAHVADVRIIDPRLMERPKRFNGKIGSGKAFLDALENFMDLANIPRDRFGVQFAATFLEGAAWTWWARHKYDNNIATYDQFKTLFLAQFAAIDEAKDARHKMDRLLQRGPVSTYADAFQTIALSLTDTSEADLLFNFIKGLKPQVRVMVETAQPKKLDDAMRIAINVDRSIYAWRSFTSKNYHPRAFYGSSAGPAASEAVPMELGAIAGTPPRYKKPMPRQPMLCWRCNKPGHKQAQCRMPPMQQQPRPRGQGN